MPEEAHSILPWLALALALAVVALIVGLLIYAHHVRSGSPTPSQEEGDGLDRPLLRQLRHEVRRALAWVATLTGSGKGATIFHGSCWSALRAVDPPRWRQGSP